eukprot:3675494-Pyramimonas_sp.AAC.1
MPANSRVLLIARVTSGALDIGCDDEHQPPSGCPFSSISSSESRAGLCIASPVTWSAVSPTNGAAPEASSTHLSGKGSRSYDGP